MPDPSEYRFEIDVFTPETLPMARLAEYMAEVAALLGEMGRVHFSHLERGSAVIVSRVDADAVVKVRERVEQQRRGEGDKASIVVMSRLNEMLRIDNGRGRLLENRSEIIIFPGRDLEKPELYPSFTQESTLDGVVIRLGGKSDPVPVWVQAEETTFVCSAYRNIARQLAECIFEREVRLSGIGRWKIDEYGNWLMERFSISSFIVLDEEPLTSVVNSLRKIPGSEWESIADPWADIMDIRNGPPERH